MSEEIIEEVVTEEIKETDSEEIKSEESENEIINSGSSPQQIKIDINDESIVKFSDTNLFVDFSKIPGLKPNTTYIMSIDNGAIISASGVAVAKFNPIVFTTGT